MIARAIDYVATAKSYGFRIQTRAEFEADPDRHPALLARAAQYPGDVILWDPEDGEECFMLVGDDAVALAKDWYENDFAGYPHENQTTTYLAEAR